MPRLCCTGISYHSPDCPLTPGMRCFGSQERECAVCDGYGEVDRDEDGDGIRCTACDGTGLAKPERPAP